jgi:hypothetical protein
MVLDPKHNPFFEQLKADIQLDVERADAAQRRR